MKRIILILTLSLACLALRAQSIPQHKSIECDFIQTRHSELLAADAVSKGKMYYAAPDKLRWEYMSPARTAFVINGPEVTVLKADGTPLDDPGANKMYKGIARFLMGCIEGKLMSDTKNFSISVEQMPYGWQAALVPLRGEAKQMFSRIDIHFDASSQSVVKVVMHEKNGGTTTVNMNNIKIDQAVDHKVFTVK